MEHYVIIIINFTTTFPKAVQSHLECYLITFIYLLLNWAWHCQLCTILRQDWSLPMEFWNCKASWNDFFLWINKALLFSALPASIKWQGVIVLNFVVYCVQKRLYNLQHTRLRTMVNGLTYNKANSTFHMYMQTIKIKLPRSIFKINCFW